MTHNAHLKHGDHPQHRKRYEEPKRTHPWAPAGVVEVFAVHDHAAPDGGDDRHHAGCGGPPDFRLPGADPRGVPVVAKRAALDAGDPGENIGDDPGDNGGQ